MVEADICIIGAGSGGLSVAAGASQLGRKVALIEKGKMGGDCLNYGCIPSKALIAAASRAAAMRDAGKFGIAPVEPEIDFSAVMAHVRGVIAAIAPHDSVERFEGLGVKVFKAAGKFTGPRTVRAGDEEIRAKHIVIATGSSPFIPPIDGMNDTPYLTNETIFELQDMPRRLIILGGGPIGTELAMAFARLGAPVSLIEADLILNREEPEAAQFVRRNLKAEGIELREKTKAVRVANGPGGVEVTLDDGGAVAGSHLLVAVGRRPDFSALALEKAGVECEDGRLKLDPRLRTTNRRIYAIGDAAGGAQFTHVAGDHASTIVRNILFKAPAKRRDELAPRVTYTDPEVASLGCTENEAQAKGEAFTVARVDFAGNDRAQAERAADGFAKAIIGKGGRLLGVTIVGEGAGDLIAPFALAIANGMKIRSFTNMIAAYPTRAEIAKRAASAYYTPTLFSPRTRKIVSLLSAFD